MPPPHAWFAQEVDYESSFWSTPQIFARPSGIEILEGSHGGSTWLSMRDGEWQRDRPADGTWVSAVFGPDGARWLLVAAQDNTLQLVHAGKPEVAMTTFSETTDQAALTLDAHGTPHICVVDTPRRTVSHVVNGVVEAAPGDSETCTIAVGDDGTVYIGTREGVAVRTNGTWKLEAGGKTIVTRARDGTVVALSAK